MGACNDCRAGKQDPNGLSPGQEKRQRRAWMTITVPMRPSTEDKGTWCGSRSRWLTPPIRRRGSDKAFIRLAVAMSSASLTFRDRPNLVPIARDAARFNAVRSIVSSRSYSARDSHQCGQAGRSSRAPDMVSEKVFDTPALAVRRSVDQGSGLRSRRGYSRSVAQPCVH
jgi:hypothetical protein